MTKELEMRLKQVEFNGPDHFYTFQIEGEEVTAEDKNGDGEVENIRLTDDEYSICAKVPEICDLDAMVKDKEKVFYVQSNVQRAVKLFRDELSGELAKARETLKGAGRYNVMSEYAPNVEKGGQQAGDSSIFHAADYDRDGQTDHVAFESSRGVQVFISQMEVRDEKQVLTYADPAREGVLAWLQPFDEFWPEARASK